MIAPIDYALDTLNARDAPEQMGENNYTDTHSYIGFSFLYSDDKIENLTIGIKCWKNSNLVDFHDGYTL